MMAQQRIDLTKLDTAIPAFITLLTIPLTYSIAHIALVITSHRYQVINWQMRNAMP